VSQKPAGICDRTDAGFSTATSAQTLGASNDAQIVSVDYCWCTSGVVCYVGEGRLLTYLYARVSYVMWVKGVGCSHICMSVCYVGEERCLFTCLYLIVFVTQSKLYAGWFYVLFSLSLSSESSLDSW